MYCCYDGCSSENEKYLNTASSLQTFYGGRDDPLRPEVRSAIKAYRNPRARFRKDHQACIRIRYSTVNDDRLEMEGVRFITTTDRKNLNPIRSPVKVRSPSMRPNPPYWMHLREIHLRRILFSVLCRRGVSCCSTL